MEAVIIGISLLYLHFHFFKKSMEYRKHIFPSSALSNNYQNSKRITKTPPNRIGVDVFRSTAGANNPTRMEKKHFLKNRFSQQVLRCLEKFLKRKYLCWLFLIFWNYPWKTNYPFHLCFELNYPLMSPLVVAVLSCLHNQITFSIFLNKNEVS